MRMKLTFFPISVVTCKFAQLRFLVLTLCVLGVLCGEFFAQVFKQTHPGVEHAQVEHKIGEDPVKINLLRLDLTKVYLHAKLGMDQIVGTETTSSIAARHGAVAAINSGFFRLDNSIFAGTPAGVLKIGTFLSESNNGRTALEILNSSHRTDVVIERVNMWSQINVEDELYDVGINRQRGENDVVVYTNEFSRTTLTDSKGVEFIVMNGIIRGVYDARGSTIIPATGFVISASGTKRELFMKILRSGTAVFKTYKSSSAQDGPAVAGMNLAHNVIGGVPQLIKNGKIDITWEQEKASRAFVFNRHPRTAVAKMKNGKFLMITVDGRQPGVSVGMTLPELADYLLALGAVDAMNLDGGGSTTMVLDGTVVNKPSDPTGERKIGDAILVTLRGRK